MTAADGFVARHGLVQYKPHTLRKYPRDGLCEICGRPPIGKPVLLFDHCPRDGDNSGMRLALAVAVLTVLAVFTGALAWAGTWIARHEPPETPAGDQET